jgi:hypothetical protein
VVLLDVLDGAGFTATGGWPVDVLNAVGVGIVLLLPLAFLAGILRGGFARAGELQELVRRLGDAPLPPDRMAAAVADALGDPTASILYWQPGERRYVDASGAPVELGPGRGVEEVTSSTTSAPTRCSRRRAPRRSGRMRPDRAGDHPQWIVALRGELLEPLGDPVPNAPHRGAQAAAAG